MMKIPNFRSSLASIAGAALALGAAVLFVPPPQHARAQFADQGAWATATSVTAGGATTVTLTLNNVSSLNDIVGVNISFNPAANSTGHVSIVVTGSAGTTASTALQRPSSLGLVALSLNELWAGETTSVKYNGSVFVLTSNVDMTRIGDTVQYRGDAVPRGTLIEDGSCVSQTTYAPLFSVTGTTYGSCSAGLFALPDSRGTMFAALDNQGVNGPANRITSSISSCNATSIGLCGAQSATLTLAQLPAGITSSGTNTVSVSGVVTVSSTVGNVVTGSITSAFQSGTSGSFPQMLSGASSGIVSSNGTNSMSGSNTTAVTSTNTGGLVTPILNPISLGRRAIKY